MVGGMDVMEHFMQLYGELPRAGPGDNRSTQRAFGMIKGLPPEPRILDIGCGPGVQTLELAKLTSGCIVALDLMPRMIERIKEAAERGGMADRIEIVQMDMNEMDFPEESFDLIWSEGAIYIMGFRNGLKKMKRVVKVGGHVAVSEAVWLKPDPPKEVLEFWEEYAEIDTVEEKTKVINELGYITVGSFVLPHESWNKDYYDHLEKRADLLEEDWKEESEEVQRIIQDARNEIKVFREYHDYYGYCFFVMKKPL